MDSVLTQMVKVKDVNELERAKLIINYFITNLFGNASMSYFVFTDSLITTFIKMFEISYPLRKQANQREIYKLFISFLKKYPHMPYDKQSKIKLFKSVNHTWY